MWVWVYECVYVNTSDSAHVLCCPVAMCVYVSVRKGLCMGVCGCECDCACVRMGVCVCVPSYATRHMFFVALLLCVGVCVCVCVCKCMYVWVGVYVYERGCMYVCMDDCEGCVYKYEYVSVCLFMCSHNYASTHKHILSLPRAH